MQYVIFYCISCL